MESVGVNDVELEFETAGRGEPVLLVHGAIVCDTYAPLLREAALARYRLIRYRRRGYGGHEPGAGPMTVEQHASDALALLDHLNATPAHIVGHSYGALVALQMAVDAPAVVHTLALLEAGIAHLLPAASVFGEAVAPIVEAYQRGEVERAVDLLCEAIFGPDYRRLLAENLSEDTFAMAVADAAATFDGDLGLMGAWTLDMEQRRSITQPVLSVIGAETDTLLKNRFGVSLITELRALVREWLPQTEEVVLPGLHHALQAQGPSAVAEQLSSFLARHPILERV